MASKTLHTNQITFMDLTDDRKLDVYIASNLPITQIKDSNANTYTPNWSSTNLVLSADIYLDSVDVTDNTNTKIIWYEQIGTSAKTQVGTSTSITIKANKMTSSAMVTYSCDVTYQGITAHSQITFTRVDTGLNGLDGNDAPAVQAQYSVDGVSGWTITLNAATHKYVKYSYDGGATWTTAIKMAGDDGTSVVIKGTAYTPDTLVAGQTVRLYSDSSNTTAINTSGLSTGDSYLVSGYLCVYNEDNSSFVCTGTIQGPKGSDGISSYVFIRYATDANGTNMSTSPSGKTYIGVYTSNTNVAPTTASVYTWSKFVGDSAKSIILSGDSQVFKVSTSNVYTPATIKITAQTFNTSVTTWTYSTNGGQTFVSTAPTGVSISGNIITITGSTLTTNSLVVKASDGTYSDVFTVYKAFDGANGNPGAPGAPASMAFLTNENVTFSANASGVITSATISTNVVTYNGATKVTPTVGTITNLPTGMTAAVGAVVNNEVPIVFTVTNSNLGSASNNNGSITIPVNGTVYTNLILTWSKVNSGAQGGIGPKGTDAYTVLLTNESHVFAGDVNNAIAGTAETQALVYIGTTPQTVKIISVNEKTAAITDTDTGIDGLKFKCDTLSGTSPKITFTCTTSFKSASGTIPIKLSVGGVEFIKMFTYSIAFKGATGGIGGTGPKGDAATAYWLVSSANVVNKTSTGTIAVTPSTLTFMGKSQTGTNAPIDYACRWIIAYSTDGTNYTNLYTSTANEASKSITVATTYKTIRARMYMAGGTTALIDEQIIPVVSDGATGKQGDQGIQGPKGNDAYTVMLTNESHIFAGDVSNAIAGSATTQVLAYNGSTAQTVTIVSVNGKTAATADTDTGIAGLKFKCSALSGASPTITFTCTTSFVSKSGAIPIVLSIGGVSFTKMFTYSIAFKGMMGNPGNPGSPGTPASLVDITPSAYYFKSTTGKDGTFTPDYIYLYPRFQTVTFSKWEYSVNGGTTWVAASGANGLSIGTYNSVVNTLRIAKTSTLYTDTVTSISFRCVSSNASVYDTVSITKIYDVVDLQIGGRNLLQKNNLRGHGCQFEALNETYNGVPTFKITANLDNTGNNFGFAIKNPVEITNGTYTVSYWYKFTKFGATTGMSGYVRVKYSDDSEETFTSIIPNQPINADNINKWFKIEQTFTTNVNKTVASIVNFYFYKDYALLDDSAIITYPKIETGNKATDWSPAPEDLNNITFQIYAPNGYLLTNDLQSLTLQTFAYEGSIEITSGATFQWSHLIDDVWTNIAGATGTDLTVTKSDVLKAKSYRCIMTYKSKTYTSTITVQDKTDTYNSIMCISSNAKGAECYWVLHTIVYSDTSEIDPLLGPISINAPESPVNGDYWYSVDSTNATVQLKKYNGTAWVNSTDKQSLTYLWNIINDGSVKTPIGGASKVQVVSCRDFTATATLMCDVSNEVDGVLTQSSLSITDASDPIVSQTEPTSAVDGQIWIKPNTNGSYNMFLWSKAAQSWIPSDMDTRNKVYTSKPSSYSKGDIWITESDTAHSKYLEGTLLQATKDSETYDENDWSSTLKYDKDIDEIKGKLYDLSQYVTITSAGLKIGAVNSNDELSPFTSLFTSTELAFYQNSNKLLTLANNQLTAPRVVVEKDLEVEGSISLGNLQFTIESNGSFSFAVTK